ncbi:hypothetical protein SAMN05661012_05742 [Chitinophaga sancti]|uniref:Uncharacterized protein n=1 Tax=Chitinophaga sancti TaxID=1004 RepID=A0A1K1SM88_9BACT|nr:hypothetical protein SAMN05661012_05742 [Chitinophaga sancti]
MRLLWQRRYKGLIYWKIFELLADHLRVFNKKQWHKILGNNNTFYFIWSPFRVCLLQKLKPRAAPKAYLDFLGSPEAIKFPVLKAHDGWQKKGIKSYIQIHNNENHITIHCPFFSLHFIFLQTYKPAICLLLRHLFPTLCTLVEHFSISLLKTCCT